MYRDLHFITIHLSFHTLLMDNSNNEINKSLCHFKVGITYPKISSNLVPQRYLKTMEINTERLSKIFADVCLNFSLLPR